MLAIGEELLALGADVKIATYPCYEQACKKSGFTYAPLGGPASYVSTLGYSRKMLENESYEMFVDRINFDQLSLQYEQLIEAADSADILVAPAHVIPAHLAAEK